MPAVKPAQSPVKANPFVNSFTKSTLKTVGDKNVAAPANSRINSDLVPKVSSATVKNNMLGEKVVGQSRTPAQVLKAPVVIPVARSVFVPAARPAYVSATGFAPVTRPAIKPVAAKPAVTKPATIVQQTTIIQKPATAPASVMVARSAFVPAARPAAPAFVPAARPAVRSVMPQIPMGGKYGKIDGLVHDPTITLIECQGVGKIITIVRAGQRMETKLMMTADEITNFLKQLADEARVPLIEGVFRAAIENFTVNAVVSQAIGSRFVITKQTPYSLLERRPTVTPVPPKPMIIRADVKQIPMQRTVPIANAVPVTARPIIVVPAPSTQVNIYPRQTMPSAKPANRSVIPTAQSKPAPAMPARPAYAPVKPTTLAAARPTTPAAKPLNKK